MIVSLGSRRQPVAERNRGQGMNVLSNKVMEKFYSPPEKEIVVAALDSKHSNGFYPEARHMQTLFFG